MAGEYDAAQQLFYETLTFTLISIIIIFLVVAPFISVESKAVQIGKETRTVTFANIARYLLISNAGGNVLTYESILAIAGGDLSSIGVAKNYMFLEDMISGENWEFNTKKEKNSYSTFSVMEKESLHITSGEYIVMEHGQSYILSIYKSGEGTVLDIYNEYICSPGETKNEDSGYMRIGCGDLGSLAPVNMGPGDVSDEVMAVINGAKDNSLVMITAAGSMSASSVSGGARLGSQDDCPGKKKELCVRVIGDYMIPLEIQTGISPGSDMVVSLEYI